MGLDLYLFEATRTQVLLGTTDEIAKSGVYTQTAELAYFRKFNALFHWVQTHVAEVKNCENMVLTQNHLQQLRETLNQLNSNNAKKLFPTRDGFFFGDISYGEYYWECVAELKVCLDELLSRFDFATKQVWFHAWW